MARLLRFLGRKVAPPRFLLFLLALAGFGLWLAMRGVAPATAFILGFDGAALLFLLACAPLLAPHRAEAIRRHAIANDVNRPMLLAVTAVVVVAILAALVGLLPHAHMPVQKAGIVVTLLLGWLFANTVYAIHYAHLYYRGATSGGLAFPGDDPPDYVDFIYFAFTLGMTFQTSDVVVNSRDFRRIVTLHSFSAFVFNLGVVAFVINVLGSG